MLREWVYFDEGHLPVSVHVFDISCYSLQTHFKDEGDDGDRLTRFKLWQTEFITELSFLELSI